MINKKGLTLVELLAVMVVLTMVFLIGVPLAEKAISKATMASYKVSAKNYTRSIESLISDSYAKKGNLVSGRFFVDEKTLTNESNELSLDVKGDTPTSGIVCVDSDGKVVRYSLKFDKYIVSNINKEQTIKRGNVLDSVICEYDASGLTISASPSGWSTSKIVTITDNSNTGIQIQYAIDQKSNWIDYTQPFEVTKNGKIYARLFDGVVGSANATYDITSIDTEYPIINFDDGCTDNPDIYSHFSVKYGISSGTFNCSIPEMTPNVTYDLTCTARSGAGLSTTFNGNVTVSEQNSAATLGEANKYELGSIEKIDVFVKAISGHSYINSGGDACDSYGSASSTLKTYGVKSDGTAEEISGASASISVRYNDSSGCNCSAKPSTCSGNASGKCKSKTITYTITDEDRSKYESIYFVQTSSKTNPTPCDTGASMQWPSTSASVTIHNFNSYCITKKD